MRTAILLIISALTALAQAPYREPYRPQFHFSPKVNWTNDPNGLVYFNETYHLFFQHNPFGDVWGHMSWGHATSTDLIHWKELPVAIPESGDVMVFTGSTVADQTNSSGFCLNGKPCLVAVYTGHTFKTAAKPGVQTQDLAYSNDAGLTWTKFPGNPVLDLHLPEFRDPKVFWSKSAKRWIMGVSLPDDHKVRFYGSPNLKTWTQLSEFGPEGAVSGQWECPELFELPVDGNPARTKWVLKIGLNPGGLQGGSGEQYFVGDFDGTRFVNGNPKALRLWTDYGKDCYCALTFNNLPPAQKQVMIGWMNNWQYADKIPTKPWRGQMTAPRALALKTYPEGVRLIQQPVDGLRQLRGQHYTYPRFKDIHAQVLELDATVDLGQATEVGWKILGGAIVGYDAKSGQVFIDRTQAGNTAFSPKFAGRVSAPLKAGKSIRFHILTDQSSIELFAADGQIAMTDIVFPNPAANQVEFYSTGKPGNITADAWALQSIW